MSTSRRRMKFKLLAVTAVVMMFIAAIPIIDQAEESDAGLYSNLYFEGYLTGNSSNIIENLTPTALMSNADIKKVSVGNHNIAILTNDGKLYYLGGAICFKSGWNYTSTLTQFATNVKDVKIEGYNTEGCVYLTNDGKLYALGTNPYGRFGSASTTGGTATQIASGVSSFEFVGDTVWYITTGGDLYGSGKNAYGSQGSGNTTNVTTFTKRASGVSKVVCNQEASVTYYIKTNGDLYAAGLPRPINGGSDGNYVTTFTKIASNVRDAAVGHYTGYYISNDNKLYAIGSGQHGCLGTGNNNNLSTFTNVASNASKMIVPSNSSHGFMYIATNGDLYGTGGDQSVSDYQFGFANKSTDNSFRKLASNVRDAVLARGSLYITNDNKLYGSGYIDRYTHEVEYEDDDGYYTETEYDTKKYQTSYKLLASNVGYAYIGDNAWDMNYCYTQYIPANVSIASADTNKGTVSAASASIFVGGNPTISGNKVTLGSTTVTATPKAATAQYTFSFSSWQYYNGSSWVSLTNSVALTSGMQIRAVFAATTNNYTVTYYDHNNAKITSYTESIPYNGTITHTTYTVSGKVFCGWYTNSSHTTSFSTSTKITANTNLYAYMVDVLAFTSSPVANATLTYSSEMGSVLFDALESQSAYRVVWDFGDGTYGDESVMYHHYDEPGTYDVLLSVYNYNGDVDTKSYVVAIYDAEVGLEKDDNTLLIAGSVIAALIVGFIIARPF